MPRWRTHRDALNRTPLAHEEWTYGEASAPPRRCATANPAVRVAAGDRETSSGPDARSRGQTPVRQASRTVWP